MGVHFAKEGAAVRSGGRVDDVEDAGAGDDEGVAEALAFGGVDAGDVGRVGPGWVLALVVGGKVADNVGVRGGGEDGWRGIMEGVFLFGEKGV